MAAIHFFPIDEHKTVIGFAMENHLNPNSKTLGSMHISSPTSQQIVQPSRSNNTCVLSANN
jgi:hypothetical protein